VFGVRGPSPRYRPQPLALEIDRPSVTGITAADELVDEPSIGVQTFEVARATQQERITDRALQMTVRALDAAVLVRGARVAAARRHAVVRTQGFITASDIVPRLPVEVAERRREAVGAVLRRRAAQRPERVLQPFGERYEALTAEDHMSMLEPRVDQPEVIEPVIELHSADRDSQIVHVGEVR